MMLSFSFPGGVGSTIGGGESAALVGVSYLIIRESGVVSPVFARGDGGILFTKGADLINPVSIGNNAAIAVFYLAGESVQFRNGMTTGLNYLRADFENDGIFESVFEIETVILNASTATENYTLRTLNLVSTDDNTNLTISEAQLALHPVPEPSLALLSTLGLIAMCFRRHRTP